MSLFGKKKDIKTEFTDGEGKKWVQTSTDDLFSLKELNDVIKSIEKDRQDGEIVLAHIDFKTVNKEYYNTVLTLQETIRKKDMLMKRLVNESKTLIDRKNKKLSELIAYIKDLHKIIAHVQSEGHLNINAPQDMFEYHKRDFDVEEPIVYEAVDEIALDNNGQELK